MMTAMERLLTSLAAALARWDRATKNPAYRWGGAVLGLGLLAGWLLLPAPSGVGDSAWRVAGVGALMALWWVGRVLPLWLTGLVPLVAFPLLGAQGLGEVALAYLHPLNLLMLGGLLLGHGVERVRLHQRLVAAVLSPAWVRRGPQRVVLAMMVVTALLSGLISNTATTLMLLPLAMGLARTCTEDRRERGAFVLALAYAASIGGASTLVGTPPNAVLASMSSEISFARWMGIGVPFVLGALPLAAWVVTRVAVRLPATFVEPPARPSLGRWTGPERWLVGILAAAFVLWLTRGSLVLTEGLVIPGWERLLPQGWAQDAWVALLGAAVLFFLPVGDSGEGRFVLEPRRVVTGVPWSVLLLLGGGFALAGAIEASGLTATLAGATSGLGRLASGGFLGGIVVLLALSALMTSLTEVASNTATSQVLLPVLAAGAVSAGIDPLLWMVPATLSASCAFMMPVATAPNAIACEAGGVAPADMAWAGLWLNGLLILWTVVLSVVLVPLIFTAG